MGPVMCSTCGRDEWQEECDKDARRKAKLYDDQAEEVKQLRELKQWCEERDYLREFDERHG